MARVNLIERRMSKVMRESVTVRSAATVIVTATTLVVVASGVLMTLLDRDEYPNVWLGMWWALQTVTTVGYGDVTPESTPGRVVGAFVMLEGIAVIAIMTAAITSSFVTRARADRGMDQEARLLARLDDVEQRYREVLSRLEQTERALRAATQPAQDDGIGRE